MIEKEFLYGKLKFFSAMVLYYIVVVHYGHYTENRFNVVAGYGKIDFNILYFLLNIIPIFWYAILFPNKMIYVSDYLVLLILLFVNIPIGYFCLLKTESELLSLAFILLHFSWFAIWRVFRNKFITFKGVKEFTPTVVNIVLIAVFLLAIFFLLKNGLAFSFYAKKEIYKVRKLFKSKEVGVVFGYVFSLMQYSIIPIIIMIGVKFKSKILKFSSFIIAVFCAFSIFSSSALKSSLFVLAFVLIGYLIPKFKLTKAYKLLFLVSFSVITLEVLKNYNSIFRELYDHSLRRILYSPSKTGVLAYDYFLNYCDNCGFFGGIGNNIGHILSKFFFKLDGNSTTGFLANSLLSRGVLGTILNILILVITLKIIDIVTKVSPLKYGLMAFIVYGYVLSNTALTSILVSYGLILSIITFKLLNKWLQKSA